MRGARIRTEDLQLKDAAQRGVQERIIVCVCEGEGEEGGWGSCDPTAPRPASQAGGWLEHTELLSQR